MVEIFRSWVELVPDIEPRFETLAGDEERIVVRFGGYGHAADGGGPLEYVTLDVATIRDGRQVRAELFDAADVQGARCTARELQGARRPSGASPAMRDLADRYVAAINDRDWDALRRLYAPDMRFIDRRLIGWGELAGADAVVEILRGAIDLAPDMRISYDGIALGSTGNLIRQLVRGHMAEGGGEFEIEMLSAALAADGVYTYFELFEGAEVPAALARFEELGRADRVRAPGRAVDPPHQRTRLGRRRGLLRRGRRARGPSRASAGSRSAARRRSSSCIAPGCRSRPTWRCDSRSWRPTRSTS